jgi:hypothetical protein
MIMRHDFQCLICNHAEERREKSVPDDRRHGRPPSCSCTPSCNCTPSYPSVPAWHKHSTIWKPISSLVLIICREPLSGTRSLRQLVVEKTSMVAAHQACLAQPPDLPDAHRLGHGRSGRCQPPPTRIPACSANTIIVDGISDSAPAAELHLGRRTARTFPLLPPPQKN